MNRPTPDPITPAFSPGYTGVLAATHIRPLRATHRTKPIPPIEPTTAHRPERTKTMPKYEYFLSYQAFTDEGPTFGNLPITLPAEITSFDQINKLQARLHRDGLHCAVILGYHLLRTIEAQK